MQTVIKLSLAATLLALVGAGQMWTAEWQVTKTATKAAVDAVHAHRTAEDRRAALDANFQATKSEVLGEALLLVDSGNLAKANAVLARFAGLKDPDLVRVSNSVRLSLLRSELASLTPTPQRQAAIYAAIAAIEPDNAIAVRMAADLGAALAKERDAAVTVASRAESIRHQFSFFDGSHRQVEKAIKARLQNPDSFEHVSTRLLDQGGDTFMVVCTFRGRNGFNGIVTNTAIAQVAPDGEVVSLDIR